MPNEILKNIELNLNLLNSLLRIVNLVYLNHPSLGCAPWFIRFLMVPAARFG